MWVQQERAIGKRLTSSERSPQNFSMAVVTYFQGRGRAEFVRWLLAATGETFSNRSFSEPEELDALRASGALAMNQVPFTFWMPHD